MDTKRCCYCQQVKPLTDFHRMTNGGQGVRGRCKTCTKLTQSHPIKMRAFTPVVTLAADRLAAYKLEARLGCSRKGRK